jgi:predicted dehydrogenase
MIGIGIIGAGYWGPKHIRNFNELPGCRATMVSDLDPGRLSAVQSQYPGIRTTTDFRQLINSPDVDAVVVVTPVSTHARLAGEALKAGKHVMVEKPLAATTAEAEHLIALAKEHNRVLMVGHTFLYNPAVHALKELIEDGVLGDIFYVDAQRLNLGLFQRDINVMWDLAPHDISILLHILGSEPLAVGATGHAYVQPGIEDVAYMQLGFNSNVRAAIHVSWLDPNKVRQITVVGSKKMAVYDDVATLDKIRVFDKGVDLPPPTTSFGEFQLSYRYGEIRIPHVASTEPLRLECQHFLDCIRRGTTPLSDGAQGLAVVRVLETAQMALKTASMLSVSNGRPAEANSHAAADKHTNGHTSDSNGHTNGHAPGVNGHQILVAAA